MNNVPSWTAIIPIRSGSKGLPGKNTRALNGIPLYMHSVRQAMEAGATKIVITTDIEEVLVADHPDIVDIYKRPDHLCLDSIPMAPVLVDVIESMNIGGMAVLLQATSPLRTVEKINECINAFANSDNKLVMSVSEVDPSILKYGFIQQDRFLPISKPEYCFSNRQSLPQVFRPNGAVYVFDTDWFRANGCFVTDSIGAILMKDTESLDIDSLTDFEVCQQRLAKS